ncbi:Uncharacterised protein [Mycobacteroides abscessus subsp. massiliense]|uniref:hypothetical protein n=1 Tax=Mycobacteroides abscessus TaxID=36809 RepID=UPI0009C7609D|nr:hypothetical protein [Mycobacteroides abscessus]SKU70320.1 Uncharacterised protein [Mycobacteroides abscessus subsp. massiliense]SKU76680.1 Uncharacterised protein [Mycobacteroides abscessus subsp. massiliense]
MSEAQEFLAFALEQGIVAAVNASDGWVSGVDPAEEGAVSTSIRVDGVIDLMVLAAEIDKALGGLTRDEAFRYTHLATGRSSILDDVDVPTARKIAGTTHGVSEVSRWVSGWTVTE